MVKSRKRELRPLPVRLLIFALLVVMLCGAVWLVFPREFRSLASNSWSYLASVWSHKELRLYGMEVLREENLDLQDARGRSVAWWHMNLNSLRARLRQNSLVQDALLRRCPDRWWNCFEIEISERRPALLAFVGDRLWMVGDDGGFIGPVSSKLLEAEDRQAKLALLGNPALVRGLLTEGASPDLLKSRLYYVQKALRIIEEEAKLRVGEVTLRLNGELEIQPAGAGFTVVFGTADQNLDEVRQEAARLAEVLARIRESLAAVESIDLAFNKRAVVKFRQ